MRPMRVIGLILVGWIMVGAVSWMAGAQEKKPNPTKEMEGKGDAEVEFKMAERYYYGNGVTQDYAEAAKWLRKAAEKGDAAAQFNLGWMYYRGEGVEKDYAEAAKWFRGAAEKGGAAAQHNLGLKYYQGEGVEKDYGEAAKWYRKAAEQGYSSAQYSLGGMYYKGEGVAKDYAEAAKWFRKAAEQGDADAQYSLGVMYYEGEGIEKHYAEGAKWFRKAAEQGHPSAQYNLGLMYAYGRGVENDFVEAYAWLNLAATKLEDSRASRDKVEQSMSAQQVAEGQKRTRELRARLENKSQAVPGISGEGIAEKRDGGRPRQSGTGFLITRDGYLVTNEHVVRDASEVQVLTGKGQKKATLVRTDPGTDLALLKIEGTWNAVPIASSRRVRRGQTVGTVGFPNIGLQGFEPKAARGEIASLTGAGDDPQSFQIGVPVQPGNSGGALVDLKGNVVGVVQGKLALRAALASSGSIPENVNYAIKSSYLLSFLESVPQMGEGLLEPSTKEGSFEDAIKAVEGATVLVLVY